MPCIKTENGYYKDTLAICETCTARTHHRKAQKYRQLHQLCPPPSTPQDENAQGMW